MARTFNGTDENAENTNNAAYNTNNADFTMIVWNRTTPEPATGDRMFTKGSTSSAGAGNGKRYEVTWNAGLDTLTFTIDDNTTKSDATYVSTTVFDDTWRIWIFERDAGTTIKIFEGATERGTQTDSTGDIDDTNSNFYIAGSGGSDGVTDSDFWPGSFAHVTLIKSLLTSDQKAAIGRGTNPWALDLGSVYYPLNGNNSPENEYIVPLPITLNGAPPKSANNPPVELLENFL